MAAKIEGIEILKQKEIQESTNLEYSLNGLVDQSDIIASLKELSEELLNDVVIKGIDGITNIVMNNVSKNIYKNGDIVSEKIWILETDGTNLLEVLNNEFIDLSTIDINLDIFMYKLRL